MAFVWRDLIREDVSYSGTGAITLSGTAFDAEHRAFNTVMANGDTTIITIKGGSESQTCYATWNTGDTLSIGTIIESTNGDAQVSFTAGTKQVFMGWPAKFAKSTIRAIRTQIFTSSGTYTPDANLILAFASAVGGGGGGSALAGATGNALGGGGGGAGEHSTKYLTPADIGASKAVTIGAAGAGGSAGNNAGSDGGDTSVGSLVVAKGGKGGGASVRRHGGLGGTGGTGTITAPGAPGGSANDAADIDLGALGGGGGSGPYGAGGLAVYKGGNGATAGNNGIGKGAGGAGAAAYNTTDTAAGGNGTAGYIVITEFCRA